MLKASPPLYVLRKGRGVDIGDVNVLEATYVSHLCKVAKAYRDLDLCVSVSFWPWVLHA